MNKIMTKNESWLLLKKEVEEYVSKNQNYFLDLYSMIKLLSFIALYVFCYANVLYAETYLGIFFSSLGFSFSLIEIGFLAHCLTHNSLFSNKHLNSYFSFFWDFFIGISKESWRYKHNSLHHIYTNINNKDEDIDTGGIFYVSPYQKKYWFHKYQWIYAIFIYSFEHFSMLIVYNIRYFLLKKRTLMESISFILGKFLFFFFLFFPFYMHTVSFFMLYITTSVLTMGLYLALVTFPAHIFNETIMSDQQEEHDFFTSQIKTTTNYAPNLFFNELFCGLNYQIEHHLFPQLHYYYYPKISHIVKKHVTMNNLTYNQHPTFLQAIISNIQYLKKIVA